MGAASSQLVRVDVASRSAVVLDSGTALSPGVGVSEDGRTIVYQERKGCGSCQKEIIRWTASDGDPSPMRLAVLGDSYISGEGAGDRDQFECMTDFNTLGSTGDGPCAPGGFRNECRRAYHAWPALLKERLGSTIAGYRFVVCSGARAVNVGTLNGTALTGTASYPQSLSGYGAALQLSDLRDFENDAPADAVIVSIGGNDAGFGNAINQCAGEASNSWDRPVGVAYNFFWRVADCSDPAVQREMLRTAVFSFHTTARALWDIRQVSPDAAVYLVGYPSGFSPDVARCSKFPRNLTGDEISFLTGSTSRSWMKCRNGPRKWLESTMCR